MRRTTLTAVGLMLGLMGASGTPASAQLMTKPQVANLIKNVENGLDEFRNYLGLTIRSAQTGGSRERFGDRSERGAAFRAGNGLGA